MIVDWLHPDAIAKLLRSYDVRVQISPSPDELHRLVRDADVLVLRSGVAVTAPVIEATTRLGLIVRAGTGVDNIDLEAAMKRGIRVANVPGASAHAVAELAIGLMIGVLRHILVADRRLRAGCADKTALLGRELRGLELGLVGFGAIGRRVGELATAFGMRVSACVQHPTDSRRRALECEGIELCDLDALLAHADVVCVAVPLSATTGNLIDAARLGLMKPSACLVNLSRAGVVDERALCEAVARGRLSGAASDVPQNERDARRYASEDRLVLTPHIGAMTGQSQAAIGDAVIAAIDAWAVRAPVPHLVC